MPGGVDVCEREEKVGGKKRKYKELKRQRRRAGLGW